MLLASDMPCWIDNTSHAVHYDVKLHEDGSAVFGRSSQTDANTKGRGPAREHPDEAEGNVVGGCCRGGQRYKSPWAGKRARINTRGRGKHCCRRLNVHGYESKLGGSKQERRRQHTLVFLRIRHRGYFFHRVPRQPSHVDTNDGGTSG